MSEHGKELPLGNSHADILQHLGALGDVSVVVMRHIIEAQVFDFYNIAQVIFLLLILT